MSDTAAFLAGCAVTGVAVLFVMRNDFSSGDSRAAPSWQSPSPTPTMQSTPLPVPVSPNFDREDGVGYRLENKLDRQQDLSRDLSDQLQRQQDRTEDMRTLLARQQQETENLKNELMRQQKNTEVLISQIQDQQRLLDRIADQPTRHSIQPIPVDTSANINATTTARIQTFIVGALGVAIVVVVAGGGLILFAIIIVVLLSSRRRQPRTVHIVHPFPPNYPAFPPQPMLPPRARSRPTQHIDVEYYDDYDS
ncbi:MAG TPA: hypothetical protein V6C65_36160 [Allocoleopsis sp.]